MKFGKQFDFYKIPEWSEFYLDYISLKKLIKYLDKRRHKKRSKAIKKLKQIHIKDEEDSNEEESSYLEHEHEQHSESNISSGKEENVEVQKAKEIQLEKLPESEQIQYFITIYKQKVGVVEQFFLTKLSEFQASFENLKKKINVKRSMLGKNFQRTDSAYILKTKQENAERDELGYAVSWKRAMSNLYNHTSWLHSYYSINSLAIQKLQKKAKKLFHMNNMQNIDVVLAETDNEFEIFKVINTLVDLRKQIKMLYSSELTNNSLSQATMELEQRMGGGGKMKHTKLISFYCGIILCSIFFFILMNFIKPQQDNSLVPFFPAFNFTLVLIEVMIGIGVNIIILRKYRINYIYIFEIDPKLRLGSAEMFQNGLMLLTIWVVSLVLSKMTLSFGLFDSQYALFSLLINLMIIAFLFFPFHCSYYEFRKGIIITLIRNLFPIGKTAVRFKDFLFGDVLTSLNKPFASLVLSFCLLACKDCRENNKRDEECNRSTVACLIVLFGPFAIRFFQCINRYYYTSEAWPHLGNTLKYVGGLSNAICAWAYSRYKTPNTLIAHIAAGVVSQSYMLFWDIYMDWNLGRVTSKNFFLRDKIVYPKKMYFFAIITDAILRFSWTWNFFLLTNKKYDEWYNVGLALLEAYRRIQWCVFRIENENTNNPEKYRTILAIPDLPMD